MNPNSERFDVSASAWDANAQIAERAQAIVAKVEIEIAGFPAPRLMDFGCGTGMCSLPLAHRCSSITGVDVSSGMLAKFSEKAEALGFSHIHPVPHDLSERPLEGYEFDVIISVMALHHVRDVPLVLKRLRSLLAPHGVLILADLDLEDGSFHEDLTGVEHHGLDRDWLLNQLLDAGFRVVASETVYNMEKPSISGNLRTYPVFLMTARMVS